MAFQITCLCILHLVHIIISQGYILPAQSDLDSNNKRTWPQAESYCLSTHNTHLLSIHDQSVLSKIKNEIMETSSQTDDYHQFWIGLLSTTTDTTIEHLWIDGTEFDFDFTEQILSDIDTNNSIDGHPQYTTLQLYQNNLLYDTSDGTQSHFWICNDAQRETQSTQESYALSIFTVLGILALLCCCVLSFIYIINLKAVKMKHKDTNTNTQTKPEAQHLPNTSTTLFKVQSASVASTNVTNPNKSTDIKVKVEDTPSPPLQSHSPRAPASPSMRSIVSELYMERMQSRSPRQKELSMTNNCSSVMSIRSVSAGTSVVSVPRSATEQKAHKHKRKHSGKNDKKKKHRIIVDEFKHVNIPKKFTFTDSTVANMDSIKANAEQNMNESKEGYNCEINTGDTAYAYDETENENSLQNNEQSHDSVQNNAESTVDNACNEEESNDYNDSHSVMSGYTVNQSRLSTFSHTNLKIVNENTVDSRLSVNFLRNDASASASGTYTDELSLGYHEIKEHLKDRYKSDGYMDSGNGKDPLDLGNNEFIVRQQTESKSRLKEIEHSCSIGTVNTMSTVNDAMLYELRDKTINLYE